MLLVALVGFLGIEYARQFTPIDNLVNGVMDLPICSWEMRLVDHPRGVIGPEKTIARFPAVPWFLVKIPIAVLGVKEVVAPNVNGRVCKLRSDGGNLKGPWFRSNLILVLQYKDPIQIVLRLLAFEYTIRHPVSRCLLSPKSLSALINQCR